MCPNDERIVLVPSSALNLPEFTGEVDPDHKPTLDFVNDPSFRTRLGCVGQYCNLKCSEEISTYGHVEGTLESKSPNGWQLTVSLLD